MTRKNPNDSVIPRHRALDGSEELELRRYEGIADWLMTSPEFIGREIDVPEMPESLPGDGDAGDECRRCRSTEALAERSLDHAVVFRLVVPCQCGATDGPAEYSEWGVYVTVRETATVVGRQLAGDERTRSFSARDPWITDYTSACPSCIRSVAPRDYEVTVLSSELYDQLFTAERWELRCEPCGAPKGRYTPGWWDRMPAIPSPTPADPAWAAPEGPA